MKKSEGRTVQVKFRVTPAEWRRLAARAKGLQLRSVPALARAAVMLEVER